jgi:hypothetical protein
MDYQQELRTLQIELWRVFKQIEDINNIAGTRKLTDEEQEKLAYLVQQHDYITDEIEETKKEIEEENRINGDF